VPFVNEQPAAPPRRVVSLCPSVTETVHALGAWDRLVGRTRYCVHPAGLVQAVPHVDGTKRPDLPRLLALEPDLVVAVKEENRREDIEALVKARVPVLLLDPNSVQEAADAARELGDALDCPIEGHLLKTRIEAAARIRLPDGPRPRVVYLIWWDPVMAVGGGTFIHSMLEAVGMQDLMGDRERYPSLAVDELAGLAPDAVLLSSEPFPFKERHREALAEATGLPVARFVLVDGELLSWHGARTVRGLRYGAELAGRLRAAITVP
jgi:iron complex transport system substrate-binding protein